MNKNIEDKVFELTDIFILNLRKNKFLKAIEISKNMHDLGVVNFISLFYKAIDLSFVDTLSNIEIESKRKFIDPIEPSKPKLYSDDTTENMLSEYWEKMLEWEEEKKIITAEEEKHIDRLYDLKNTIFPLSKKQCFKKIISFYKNVEIQVRENIVDCIHNYFLSDITEKDNLFYLYDNTIKENKKIKYLKKAKKKYELENKRRKNKESFLKILKGVSFLLDSIIITALIFSFITNLSHSVILSTIFSFELSDFLLEMPRKVYLIIIICISLSVIINIIINLIREKLKLLKQVVLGWNILITIFGVIAIVNCILIYTTGYSILGFINSILW